MEKSSPGLKGQTRVAGPEATASGRRTLHLELMDRRCLPFSVAGFVRGGGASSPSPRLRPGRGRGARGVSPMRLQARTQTRSSLTVPSSRWGGVLVRPLRTLGHYGTDSLTSTPDLPKIMTHVSAPSIGKALNLAESIGAGARRFGPGGKAQAGQMVMLEASPVPPYLYPIPVPPYL